MIEEMYKEEFGAEMDSHSSSENTAGNKGKADEAISSEYHEEFQSPSSAANPKHGATAGHHLSAFKSEAIGGMDAAGVGVGVGLSSLDGAIGSYATSLNLGAVGNGSGGLQEAFAHHHGGGDARFVQAYGDMAGLGGYDGGSVSLTLGLQHAGAGNAGPDGTGRFSLRDYSGC